VDAVRVAFVRTVFGDESDDARSHFDPIADRMNLAWRTVKATGDHFYSTRNHFNLISRTVKVIGDRKKVARDHLNLIFRTVKVIDRRKKVIWRVARRVRIGSPPAHAAVTAFATRAKR